MNGQLSEHPPGELIREITSKSLAGKLQLERERIKVVVYFDNGALLYAASNLRTLRLREYLRKTGVAEAVMDRYGERRPDLELAKSLLKDNLLSSASTEQLQTRQVTDTLRLGLSWAEGTWDFDQRARLDEAPKLSLDMVSLLLDSGRHTPPKIAASRFRVQTELISPVAASLNYDKLLPTEGFLLTRVDRPTSLQDLVAVSGMSESDALVIIYSLALAGLLEREQWKLVLGEQLAAVEPEPKKPEPPVAVPFEEKPAEEDVETFLERLGAAQTFYDVLDVSKETSPEQMKLRYYELARRYHPDRFRRADPSLLSRTESAFARITQAYDTLRDDTLRANYDAKLAARQKAQRVADAATPKTTEPAPAKPATTSDRAPAPGGQSVAQRAEAQFKEGLVALETGDRKIALGLFAAAAGAVPKEARYRAQYGRLLAEHEHTQRAAENELQAAIKLDPKNGEYRVMLAELYRDLGLMLRARGEAERAIASDPNNQKARDLLRALKSV